MQLGDSKLLRCSVGKITCGSPSSRQENIMESISGEHLWVGSQTVCSNTFNIGSGFARLFIAGVLRFPLRITLRKWKILL